MKHTSPELYLPNKKVDYSSDWEQGPCIYCILDMSLAVL